MEHARFVVPLESPLYAPHHVALGLGLFAAEGLEVEHATGVGPSGVTRALLGGEADIGLSGPIRALGALDRGEGRLTCVAEVTSRVGFYLLSRGPEHDFGWRRLAGRRVLVFSEAPTPRLCLEYLLERHGVSLASVELVADLPSPLAVERFVGGRGDYLLEGQPVAEGLLSGGRAHLAAALGPALGHVAFSAYLASPRFLAERPQALGAALRALYRGQLWVQRHTPEEIAAAVAPALPAADERLRVAAIRRYLGGKTWAADPILRRPALDALQEILLLRGFLRRTYPYEALVDMTHAEAAVRAVGAN